MDAAYATSSSYRPQPQFDGPRAGPFSAALFFGGIGIATTYITLIVRYKERHPNRIKYLIGFAGMSLLLSAVVFFASTRQQDSTRD